MISPDVNLGDLGAQSVAWAYSRSSRCHAVCSLVLFCCHSVALAQVPHFDTLFTAYSGMLPLVHISRQRKIVRAGVYSFLVPGACSVRPAHVCSPRRTRSVLLLLGAPVRRDCTLSCGAPQKACCHSSACRWKSGRIFMKICMPAYTLSTPARIILAPAKMRGFLCFPEKSAETLLSGIVGERGKWRFFFFSTENAKM